MTDPRHRRAAIACLLAATLAGPRAALAQEGASEPPPPPPLPAVPEPPDIPKQVRSGEAFEPEVTIRRDAKRTVTEYRVNGVVRAIKVENEGMPAYYLVDTDGDGKVDTHLNRWAEDMIIPQWILFRW
jgi:hypothetical protein